MNTRKKYVLSTMLLVLILIILTIGYAYLSASLNINGTSKINDATWNIYWDNVKVKSGSVTADTPTIDTSKTTVTYNVTLNNPGDYYEFTVDAKNDGSIDAMIDTISSKLNGTEITTLPTYLNYSITYNSGDEILPNQLLKSNTKQTYKLRVEFNRDITTGDLPTTEQNLTFSFTVTYKQANSNGIEVRELAHINIGNTNIMTVNDLGELYGETTDFTSVEDVAWQLFYDDEDYIYLISSSTIPKSTLPPEIYTEDGDYDFGWFLNRTGNYSFTSVILSVERWLYGEQSPVFEENPLTSRYLKWVDPNRDIGDRRESPADVTAYMMDMEVWKNFAGDIDGAFAMGGPTIEMFALSYNRKHNLKLGTYEAITTTNTNEFGYYVKLGDGEWEEAVGILEGTYGDMWTSCGDGYSYWISSPSSNVDFILIYDCERAIFDVSLDYGSTGFRPIVAIPKSSIE